MPAKFCLDCRELTRNGSRCKRCQQKLLKNIDNRRGTTTQRGYGSTWRKTAATAVASHRQQYGDVCPGWNRPAHPATDLTGDHRIPKAAGGTDEPSNVQVLCRSCNSAKNKSTGKRR
jgi:5-methylcytosine-specific restriction protein A